MDPAHVFSGESHSERGQPHRERASWVARVGGLLSSPMLSASPCLYSQQGWSSREGSPHGRWVGRGSYS